MRTIILILIFINLAFFYWARDHRFNDVLLENPKAVASYKPIELLSEAAQNNTQVSASQPRETPASQKKLNTHIQKCFSLGPFQSNQESEEIYESLLRLGIQAKQRAVNERQPKSYWVYLPAYESQAAAEAAVEFLKKNKVSEFYIWLEPPLEYAVSLGLFTSLTTARNKIAEIKKLDLAPKMEVRFDEFTEYWIDFNRHQDDQQPKVLEDMLRKNDRMLILETKCL